MAHAGKSHWSGIQLMRNHDCFISAAPSNGGIQINSSWMHPDVNRHLFQWFPQVFDYFDKNPSWTVSQRTIPDDIYELWNTEPLVLGSDSEVDSDASGESFHGTEIVCLSDHNHDGSSSNINVKLSSLMIELDLHYGDDHIIAKVMGKGKGVEKHCLILEMPPQQSNRAD
ncbi:hypothetical protein BKA82DRAFT_4014921 [Pisolithus tinctorius]|nr:hypothetical protein BKA82DRAFT_4014921 [Pisolithus tinctorius]